MPFGVIGRWGNRFEGRHVPGKAGTKDTKMRDAFYKRRRVPSLEEEHTNYMNSMSTIDIDPAEFGNCSMYSMDQRLKCATMFALTGNLLTAADQAEVPYELAKKWKHTGWWETVIRQVRDHKAQEFDAKCTEIIEQALHCLALRIMEGDEVVTNKGEVVKLAVKAKDLAYVTSTLFDKRAMNRGEATSRVEKVSTDDVLKKLQNKFEQMTQGRLIEGERVDDGTESNT